MNKPIVCNIVEDDESIYVNGTISMMGLVELIRQVPHIPPEVMATIAEIIFSKL